MNKLIVKKDKEYVVLCTDFLHDRRLSLAQKGFMATVCGLSENYTVTIKDICKISTNTFDEVSKIITELQELGYIKTANDGYGTLMIYESVVGASETPVKTNKTKKVDNDKEKENKDELTAFAEEMYKLYPSRCPMRNTSTGKCSKDKQKIIKLLKTYSKEEIKAVIQYVVKNSYGKDYLKNFGTFLNNFPDPKELGIIIEEENDTTKNDGKLVINGVEYK